MFNPNLYALQTGVPSDSRLSICVVSRVRQCLVHTIPYGTCWLLVQFRGVGFLHKMVRHMVGAAVATGAGLVSVDYIRQLLQHGLPPDMAAGVTRGWDVAEARGLTKVHVEYPTWVDAHEPVPHAQVQVDNNAVDDAM